LNLLLGIVVLRTSKGWWQTEYGPAFKNFEYPCTKRMFTYSNRLQPVLQNLLQRVVWFFHLRLSWPTHISADICSGRKSLVKSVMWWIYRVVRFFHPRSSCTTMHISADVQRITLNALCMTISDERTKRLVIFCHVTGFMSDFLSFIDVELIRFFHGSLQLVNILVWNVMPLPNLMAPHPGGPVIVVMTLTGRSLTPVISLLSLYYLCSTS